MKLITELYFNNIDPNGKGFESNDDYNNAMQVIGDNEEQLMKKLQGDEKKLFSQLMNAHMTVLGEGSVTNFELGFKLGARFATEILDEDIKCCLKDKVN